MTYIFTIFLFVGVSLLIYFLRRNYKVNQFRLSLVEFVYGKDTPRTATEWGIFYSKRNWLRSLPSYEKMVWSFKPLKSFLIGEFSEAALEYIKKDGKLN